jgi:tetratricopeptide (TPR) repeat protein
MSWAEELIEPARIRAHPRLAYLYQVASVCYLTGRPEQGLAYVESMAMAKRDGCVEVPFGLEGLAGGVYLMVGQPQRYIEWCREYLDRGFDTHGLTRSALVNALVFAGSTDEAINVADGLIEDAEATGNPWALSYALLSYGFAYQESDPLRALDAARRGFETARDSGNRFNESHMANLLAGLEVKRGDPLAALDDLTLAICNYQDAGSVGFLSSPLAYLAQILHQVGHFDSAAVVASFAALNPMTITSIPQLTDTIRHIRASLDPHRYAVLARKGETMTPSAMVTYAYEQIDQARTELGHRR